MRVLIVVFCLLASSGNAHELWIEPENFQPQGSENIVAHILNGQDFEGFRLSYLPRSFKRFEILAADQLVPVESRLGNRPAVDQPVAGQGVNIVVYETRPQTISYDTLEKFDAFAENHGISDIDERHLAFEFPSEDFKEIYTRYSKSLVGVGDGRGSDQRTGLEAELVLLDNPYAGASGEPLSIQLVYQDEPLADAQIELYARSADDAVTVTLHQTDANGIASLVVSPDTVYQANAVIFRQPHERHGDTDAVWETLWANLTFQVPAR